MDSKRHDAFLFCFWCVCFGKIRGMKESIMFANTAKDNVEATIEEEFFFVVENVLTKFR